MDFWRIYNTGTANFTRCKDQHAEIFLFCFSLRQITTTPVWLNSAVVIITKIVRINRLKPTQMQLLQTDWTEWDTYSSTIEWVILPWFDVDVLKWLITQLSIVISCATLQATNHTLCFYITATQKRNTNWYIRHEPNATPHRRRKPTGTITLKTASPLYLPYPHTVLGNVTEKQFSQKHESLQSH